MRPSRAGSLSRSLAAGLAALTLSCGTEPPRLESLRVVGGNGQIGIAGRPLADPLVVEADDEDGNPIEGLTLQFDVTQGGGAVNPAEATTDADGHASVEFTLGDAPGAPQEVTVSGGADVTASFTATATGVPTSVRLAAGNSQSARSGLAVPTAPAVKVLDATNQPVPGVMVSFAVTSGGGSVTGATAPTDGNGVAAVGQWRLGASGVNTLEASVDGETVTGEPVTFVATTTPAGGFDIVVRFIGEPPSSTEALAFAQAEIRWERVITGDLEDGTVNLAAGKCGTGTPALNETVDDVVILASFRSIDGPGNVLAQAGPCAFRDANNDKQFQVGDLPGVGVMNFDTDDIDFVEQNGLAAVVITHEMGHVLGFGSLWSDMGLLADPSLTGGGGADPHFTGAAALAAFDAAGGLPYLGAKVPVQDTGGPGNADAHWRDSVFGNELMTGFVDLGDNPLSTITAASLADQGYEVDQTQSDPYSLSLGLRAGPRGPSIALPADVLRLPLHGLGKVK